MSAIELRFLGEVEVLRDGTPLALPPSRKTRALLAYLVLSGRPARRDHLCELLWELPDDPRGALRWSLSKLRRLVDDESTRRIVADRSQVAFEPEGASIDVHGLHDLVAGGLESIPTEALEDAAVRYRGNLLDGLELTQLHAFYAWCVSERDRVGAAQAALLEALVERHADEPERALPHARMQVVRSPYDETLRADLIRLLVALGRADEADQQVETGRRMLKEVGADSGGLLIDARHATPARSRRPASEPDSAAAEEPRAAKSSEQAAAPGRSSWVGRDAEAARLEAGLATVLRERRASLLHVRGEPGIGKSRLLEVAADLARAQGAYLLEAAGFESETIRPFALWVDALRRLGVEGEAEPFGGEGRGDRDQLFGALNQIVARESERGPVVLLFDDLHWCDESSAAALHYVCRMNRDRPVFAVVAAREDEVNDNAPVQQALRGLRKDGLLEDLRLEPLPEEAIAKLIAEHAPGEEALVRSSDCRGNPLLAIELARSQRSHEDGASLQELVRERLASLDLDDAEVLRWAALLTPRIDAAALARVAGLSTARVREALESAERLALLRPFEHGFRFTHDLMARSIYGEISSARRMVMHAKVAELLEQDAAVDLDRAADLAHHAPLSGDASLAARAMVLAGRLCLRFFANDDALSQATRGLRWAEQLPDSERVRLTIELRDVMLTAAPLDDWESAAEDYVALAEQALDHGALSHARLGYHMASYVRWLHGQWSGAREQTLQAERVTRGASEEDQIIGMAEAARCLAMLERDLAQADAMLMEAKALAERSRVRHQALPAADGILCFHRGELAQAEERFLEARTLCKSAGDRVLEYQANEYLVMIELERDRPSAALERCVPLLEIGEKIREGSEAPFARALDGLSRYAIDDSAEGLDTALGELRIADAKHRLAYALTRAAGIDLERDRCDRAIERAGEALECAIVLERATDVVLARIALFQAAQAKGDLDAAGRHREALAEMDQTMVAVSARDRAAEIALAGG